MNLDTSHLKPSHPVWLELNSANLDEFLTEAADCERKASALAMQFTSKYPKYKELMIGLVDIAIGNLQNFQTLLEHFDKKGIEMLREIQKNLYTINMIYKCRHKHRERLLDKFIVASLLELRAAERYDQLISKLETKKMQALLSRISARKKIHSEQYLQLAAKYFKAEEIKKRVKFFLRVEQNIIRSVDPKISLY
jgi:tRNA-(ms[2]io[6]A)-hydroxylase